MNQISLPRLNQITCLLITLVLLSATTFFYSGIYATTGDLNYSEMPLVVGKSMGTRLVVWYTVWPIITAKLYSGHGLFACLGDIPVSLVKYNIARTSLSSHSDLFESLFRGGIVLAFCYALTISSILNKVQNLLVSRPFMIPFLSIYIIAIFYATASELLFAPFDLISGFTLAFASLTLNSSSMEASNQRLSLPSTSIFVS